MGIVNFSAAPIDPNEKANQKKLKQLGVKKKTKSIKRREIDPDATVYGDELFKSAYKPEATIVLKFHPLDSSCLRIETEGNYAIQYYENKEEFVLYCFKEPLENFEWVYHPPFEIKEDEVETHGPFSELDLVKEALSKIVREKYLIAKEKKKAEIFEAKKLVQESQDKTNELKEQLDEQLANAGLSNSESNSERQAESTTEISEKEEQVLLQEKQETNTKIENEQENREARTDIPKKIVGFNPDGSLIYG